MLNTISSEVKRDPLVLFAITAGTFLTAGFIMALCQEPEEGRTSSFTNLWPMICVGMGASIAEIGRHLSPYISYKTLAEAHVTGNTPEHIE